MKANKKRQINWDSNAEDVCKNLKQLGNKCHKIMIVLHDIYFYNFNIKNLRLKAKMNDTRTTRDSQKWRAKEEGRGRRQSRSQRQKSEGKSRWQRQKTVARTPGHKGKVKVIQCKGRSIDDKAHRFFPGFK